MAIIAIKNQNASLNHSILSFSKIERSSRLKRFAVSEKNYTNQAIENEIFTHEGTECSSSCLHFVRVFQQHIKQKNAFEGKIAQQWNKRNY